MAQEIASSGTQAATINTEHSLFSETPAQGPPIVSKTYQLEVDVGAMALGDKLELRVKKKTLNGGTTQLAFIAYLEQAQGEDIIFSIPVPSGQFIEFTLKQTAGTGRSFPWAVHRW